MLIRSANPADVPGILTIYNDVIATSTAVYSEVPATLANRRAWHDDRVRVGYPVLVACEAGDILGFSSYGDFRTQPGYRFSVEHSVHVAQGQRGRGLGAALIEALLPLAVAQGKHVMIGGIDAANAASIRLHERLGFERVALMPQVGYKFGRWLDLVFMQRRLGPAVGPLSPAPIWERP